MSFCNEDDTIDSREVIARLEELRKAKFFWEMEIDDLFEDQAELDVLEALESEAGSSAYWNYGETLIRADHFVEYTRSFIHEIGDYPRNLPSYIAIDWERTARNIRPDYTSVNFDGVEYLIRT